MKHFVWAMGLVFAACTGSQKTERLPIYGNVLVENKDSVYHTVMDFSLMDQDSVVINNETLGDKVYVADFFFTSCPSICPTMKAQMRRVYQEYVSNEEVMIVSHTIDPEYDSIPLLREYANRLGVSAEKWKFLWGTQEEVYELAEESYMSVVEENEEAPGGFIHSGAFLLVDKDRRIRGVYDGTLAAQVDILISDIKKLLGEYRTDQIK